MNYEIKSTRQFKKDYRLAKKQNKNFDELFKIIGSLSNGEALSYKYKDHILFGEYNGCRECHIGNDWLLIYKVHEDVSVIVLHRVGTHSELFR